MSRLLTTANGSFPASKQEFHEISPGIHLLWGKTLRAFFSTALVYDKCNLPRTRKSQRPLQTGQSQTLKKTVCKRTRQLVESCQCFNWWPKNKAGDDSMMFCSSVLCLQLNGTPCDPNTLMRGSTASVGFSRRPNARPIWCDGSLPHHTLDKCKEWRSFPSAVDVDPYGPIWLRSGNQTIDMLY